MTALQETPLAELKAEIERRRVPTQFVVECVWSGYRPSQERVCHRSVEPKRFADAVAKFTRVEFGDGTSMTVSVRPRKPREKVEVMKGYTSLLRQFVDLGVTGVGRVCELPSD